MPRGYEHRRARRLMEMPSAYGFDASGLSIAKNASAVSHSYANFRDVDAPAIAAGGEAARDVLSQDGR
jgi:hypothetical protein